MNQRVKADTSDDQPAADTDAFFEHLDASRLYRRLGTDIELFVVWEAQAQARPFPGADKSGRA